MKTKPILSLLFALIVGTWTSSILAAEDPYERLFQAQLAIAEKGDAQGMYYLGEMYDHGLGTKEDRTKAVQWYTKAAQQGNPLAKKRLDEEAKHSQLARVRTDSEKEAEVAKKRAAEEAQKAARAAEAARRQNNDESAKAAKAAEAAKKKAEDEAERANERLAKLELARKSAADKEATRRAAFKKAWEAEQKRAKLAGSGFE